jgi:hypothetical protein
MAMSDEAWMLAAILAGVIWLGTILHRILDQLKKST